MRVLLYAVAPPGDRGMVEAAYHQVSRDLLGTPGLLANELLHSVRDPCGFVIMSEWESLAAFSAWEQGARHRRTTAPLRPLQDAGRGRTFEVYEVRAAY